MKEKIFSPSCPLPFPHKTILMAHGGGGRLTKQLIEGLFVPAFENSHLKKLHDGASIPVGETSLAFTTDSYVVHPLFFPGGDIGRLSLCGTVNDLAMCGARPLYISVSFILEEGLPVETLQRIVESMRKTALEAGVEIVTGDTKVVDRGKGDGLYINTSGIGLVESPGEIGPASVREGDKIIVSGDLGRHGMAIMAVREGLGFETALESDCAPLWKMVEALLREGVEIHCLRDLTRGGLGAALVEIGESSQKCFFIREKTIPLSPEVRAACEILGLDPLFVANEGRFVAFVPPGQEEKTLGILRSLDGGSESQIIGEVLEGSPHRPQGKVVIETSIGASRLLDLFSGEQLPRIC